MAKLTNFPHLSQSEFDEACTHLHTHFQQYSHLQDQWLSLDHRQSFDTKYLRITKGLLSRSHPATIEPEHELEIEEDGDEEALPPSTPLQSVLQYDILLSPTYSVPTLYISIKDPLHRYPPTMSTLYETVIPPEYSSQTKDFGVLGGITIADHPITNRPAYFIHPCKTVDVLEASTVDTSIDVFSYLLLWMGAMGKCVGLDVPLALVASITVQQKEAAKCT